MATRDKQDRLAQYNTYDARNLFCELVRRVRRGERIVIAHAGVPVAVMSPYEDRGPTRPGVIRAQLDIHAGPEAPAATATPTRSSREASS